MQTGKGLRILAAAFIAAMGIVTWQELKSSANDSPIGWPRPSRYLGVAIVYAMLGFLAEILSGELAAVLGVGMLFGLLMQSSASNAGNGSGNLQQTPQSITTLQV